MKTKGLERAVRKWIKERAEDYSGSKESGVLEDLMYGGCASGMVGDLIYYGDTTRFYNRHRVEIGELLATVLRDTESSLSEIFGDNWDLLDPLALGIQNQNLLAWFGFEETARRVGEEEGWLS